ncbi:MAG: AAA family ATPase [bacterium]|nr:AAA family ATPase [bacterium]
MIDKNTNMDKGAHFYKCDFQVHTPRDTNWNGDAAVSDIERKAYAEELIQACRTKGLDAIAITDHHDFAFFPFIKKSAQDELDDSGNLVTKDRQIVVFPGIELTLTAPACQVILLLDANFPENLLQSVLTALSISPASPTDEKHAKIERVPQNVISDLSDLYQKLSSHDHLKGRFIVIPNVSETGHGTMLRTGFGNFYKTMPCVGGYTDGPVSKFGTGNLSIIQGKNRDYGFKAIGVFQTSDNRKRNHDDLGKYTTWIKWSEPTAEALRQACLAKESRLSQDEPLLPNIWIMSISVSASKFLGRIELDLSQQYNAIIGGRGTGKSTILEYLRWGLCDQPSEDIDFDNVQKKRKTLIDNTLQKFDGEVHVTFLLNGVKHIVKRNSKKQEILLKIGDSDFAQTTEQEIRNLLPIQAYSQKQLSSVGVRIEELRRFVELPIKQDLDQTRSEIRDTESKLRIAYGNLVRKREIETEVSKYNIEASSLVEQLKGLRDGLKGLSKDEQAIINRKIKYDNEESIIGNFQNTFSNAKTLIETLKSVIDVDPPKHDNDSVELENKTLIDTIRDQFSTRFVDINVKVTALDNIFDEASLDSLTTEIEKWTKLKTEFDKKYEAVKATAKANQQQLAQIQQLEKRIAELKKLQIDKRNSLETLAESEKIHKELRQKWDIAHTDKITALGKQCMQFTSLSNGLIKAEITNSLDIGSLMQRFKIAFNGLNIKEEKIEKICQCLVTATDPLAKWNDILTELEKLAWHSADGTTTMPDTPTLGQCGFIDSERARIVAGFDSEKWINLAVTELEFNPKFSYCTNQDKNEYIEFSDASAGQQATALLTVLLNQNGAPLIIDQPEDDVDSKMITDIVKQIWLAKSNRQLIFASHNANFVVNGDAELVVCCDYVKAADQTNGHIKAEGAIDNKAIKEEITLVTEGGPQAFKLRKDKYGF